MKRIIIFLFSALLVFNISVTAQNKLLTIEDATFGQWYNLAPERLYGLDWRKNTHDFVYIDYSVNSLISGNISTKGEKVLFKLQDINNALKNYGYNTIERFPSISWINKDEIYFQYQNSIIVFNISKKNISYVIKLKENAKNIFFNPKVKTVAFTSDNNLFIANTDGIKAITNDTSEGIVNGSDYVHRQEFGIDHGIFWSPSGEKLAFYRKDESMVAQYPLVKLNTRIAQAEMIRYPMAGETSENVTLGVYDLKSGKTVFMKTGTPKDHYLTQITWEPSEKYIYIGILNRDQNHLKLNKYDSNTGRFVKTLFEEKNDKWVEPEKPLYFLPDKTDKFLYFSERDGYTHLYLYDTEGKLIKQITKGEWVVLDIIGFDKNTKNVFITATKDSPIEVNAYKVNLKNGKILRLTKTPGIHYVTLSYDGEYLLDNYNSITIPRKIDIVDNDAKTIKNLLTSSDPLAEYKLGQMSIGTIKAADGKTDLYYRLIKPIDFDPAKKYKTIVYVYGGPHAQLIKNQWLGGARLWEYYMAQKGYVVFVLDNRGSANRGFEFESVIHRHLGVNEMKDQMKGVEFLKKTGFVDTTRIGVHGWSFGGFMTISLLTTYPDVFKVGVAGGPVIDWKYYEVMYGERYMDTPQQNPDGYNETSLIRKAPNLKAKLLILHGTMDPVVVWQNSLNFINACIKNGIITVTHLPYPGHEHNIYGRDRIHLLKLITNYFDENL